VHELTKKTQWYGGGNQICAKLIYERQQGELCTFIFYSGSILNRKCFDEQGESKFSIFANNAHNDLVRVYLFFSCEAKKIQEFPAAL